MANITRNDDNYVYAEYEEVPNDPLPELSTSQLIIGILIEFLIVISGLAIIFYSVPFLISNKVTTERKTLYAFIITVLSLLFYIFSIFKTVSMKESAVITLFGRPYHKSFRPGTGLVLVPPILFSLIKIASETIISEFPAKREKVQLGDDKEELKPGNVRPIRIPTGSPATLEPEEQKKVKGFKDDPLSQNRLVLGVYWAVHYRIHDIKQFIRTIGNLKKLEDAIRQASESALNVEFGQRVPAMVLNQQAMINQSLELKLQRLVKQNDPDTPLVNDPAYAWGVTIISFQLQTLDLSHNLSEAIRDASEAVYRKNETITKAEGEKQKRILEGEGTADATGKERMAETKGLKEMADIAKTEGGKFALKTELLKRSLENANYSVLPNGYDLLAGLAHTLDQTRKENADSADNQDPTKKSRNQNKRKNRTPKN